MARALLTGLVGVFFLLSFQFRSYIEPLIVMVAIPFALIGVIWGQKLKWINEIEYYYGQKQKEKTVLHVVTCRENWQEVDKSSGEIINKISRHAWISCKPLRKDNLHEHCNLAARYGWGIETNILLEKHHGYQYEHCFSYDWKAMKGYHYLMHLAHLMNVLVEYSEKLSVYIKENGIRNLIQFAFITLTGPWLDGDIEEQATTPLPTAVSVRNNNFPPNTMLKK